jgi:hypothetical protein
MVPEKRVDAGIRGELPALAGRYQRLPVAAGISPFSLPCALITVNRGGSQERGVIRIEPRKALSQFHLHLLSSHHFETVKRYNPIDPDTRNPPPDDPNPPISAPGPMNCPSPRPTGHGSPVGHPPERPRGERRMRRARAKKGHRTVPQIGTEGEPNRTAPAGAREKGAD